MENRNLLFGVIALLVIAVVGLAVDRSNQITNLTDQAEIAANNAQAAADDLAATIEAQVEELDISEEALSAIQTQMAVSSTEFMEQITEINSAVSVLESNNEGFATQVAGLTSDNDRMATDVADLTTERDDLSEQRDGLTTQVAQLENEVATAEANNLIMGTQSALDADAIATLEADNTALMTQIAEVMATETPEPEITIAELSELEFVFQVDALSNKMVAVSPDSSTIAVLYDDNVIEFFSAQDGTSLRLLDELKGNVDSFKFSNNGRLIALVSDFSLVNVIDATTGVVTFEQAIRNPVKSYDFSGDDGALVIQTGLETQIIAFEPAPRVNRMGGVALDWSDDGAFIATTDGNVIELLMLTGFQIDSVSELVSDGEGILNLVISPDGTHLAATTADAMVMVWHIESGEMVWSDQVAADTIDDLDWSGDSAYLAIVADSDVTVYRADGTTASSAFITDVTGVDWSADSTFILFDSENRISVVSADSLTK